MTARETEEALISLCAATARGEIVCARNAREANVLRMAALTLLHRFPAESAAMLAAARAWFAQHPADEVEAAEVIRRGWVLGLPRFREMLSARLKDGVKA